MGKDLNIRLLFLTLFISLLLTFSFATPAYAAENDGNIGFIQRIVNFFFPANQQQQQENQPLTSDPEISKSIEDQLNVLGISSDSVEALNQRLIELENLTAILQENSLKAATILPGATYTDLVGKTIIDSSGNIYPSSSNPSLGKNDRRFSSLYLTNFTVNSSGDTSVKGNLDVSNRSNLNGEVNIGGKLVSNIIPNENNKYTLGNTDNRFDEGFIKTLTGTNVNTDNLTVNSSTNFATELTPRTDNTYDVGSAAKKWRTGYFGTSVVVGNTVTITTNTVTGSADLTINSTGTNALNLDSTTTGNVNLGTGNNAKTINIGTGTAGNTINIGNNNTNADTIQIGSALDSTTIVGANWSVTPAGAASFNSTGTFGSTLTAQNGFTLTTGALNLTAASGAFNLSGLGESSINTGANNLLITSGNFNTTATGINGTNIGATTPGTAAFTTLSSTGTTTLGNNSATVAIDSSDWDINATGDMTGIGAVTMDGNFSQTGATTFSTGTGAISLNGNTTVTGTNTFAANGDTNLNANTTIGDATTDRLTVNSQILGATPFVFQGLTDNGFTTTFSIFDPTQNRNITFPDDSGTVILTGDELFTLAATSGTNSTILQGGIVTLTAGDDITTTGNGTGAVTIANTSTLASVTGRGATTTTLVNLNGGIAVDTSNFTVDGTTGAVTSASTFNGATLSGGNLSGGTFSGGSVSGGSLTGGTYTATGLTVTGNYTATINNSGTFNISDGTQNIFTLTDAGTRGSLSNIENITANGNLTVDENITLGTAITDLLTINAALQGASPLVFEGLTADGAETFITITDPSTDRTINIPNASGTFAVSASTPISLSAAGDISCTTCVTLDGTQTLTNKTLTTPVISTISNTGTITLPTSTTTLVGRDTTDTLTNKTIAAGSNTISGLAVSNFASANLSNWTNDAGFITASSTDTLTNKTLTTPIISVISNTGTLTLPTSTDTLVGRDTTDTLTNKSLTSATITGTPTAATATWANLGTVTTIDIDGGSIDGTAIGANSASTGKFTGLQASNIGIGIAPTANLIELAGGAYSDGTNWVNASDRNLKTNFVEINADEVLGKIVSLPITEWNYKTNDGFVRHIGPMAQDFYAAFKLGGSDTSISTIDPSGVALVGIQALNKNLLSTTYKVDEIGLNVNSIDEQVKAANSVFDNFNKETENLKNENATIKEQLALVIDRLGKLETLSASNSAQVASQSAQVAQEITPLPVFESSASAQLVFGNSIKADEATISGKLMSYGETYLARTLFVGDIFQDGTFSITGGNTINALPILFLQTSSLAQGVDLFNGKVTADKDGNIKAAGEIAGKQIAVSNDSAGTGSIKAGETKVVIHASLVQDNSLIFVTPTSATDKVIYIGSKVSGQEFSVETKSSADTDITFNWWIVKRN